MVTIFTTEDPKEGLRIQKATDMANFINDVTYDIRRRYLKYDDTLTQEQHDVVEKVFEDIFERMHEYDINLEYLL